jgi:hypothetical protein
VSAPLTLPTEGHIRIGPGEPRTEPESVGSVSGVHEKPRPEAPTVPETAGEPGMPGGAAPSGPAASHVPSSGVATFVPVAGAPATGLYPGVPFAEYLRWPAISASLLKTYLGRSPLPINI